VSKLVIGTAQFGLDYGITNHDGQVPINEVKKILNFAKKNNINTLDTASNYGNSEDVLGKICVGDYHIITKTTSLKNGANEVIKNFHHSLKKIKKTKVKGLLVHNIEEVKDSQFSVVFKQLNELKRQGLVEKIGFSTYTPKQIDFLLNNFDFDLVQLPFNVFDNRLIQGGQLKALKKKKIEIHARSIFLQGLLLDFNNLSDYFLTWKNEFDVYQDVVKESGLSKLEYALNFVLSIKEIDKVLVGVNSKKELKEIVQSVKDKEELNAYSIDDINLLNPSLWKI
jgi:aryl-alcohol dehydrogenase-like predicted oxidoreductase